MPMPDAPHHRHPDQAPGNLPFDTIRQVADRWQTSTRTVRRFIKRGDLIAHKFGGEFRISRPDRTAFERINRLA